MKNSITVWHETPELIEGKLSDTSLDIRIKTIPSGLIGHQSFPLAVLPTFCSDCTICEGNCPNLEFDKKSKIMRVNPIACRGCGACITSCPTGALQQRDSHLGSIEKDISQLLDREKEEMPAICNRCPVVTGEIPLPDDGSIDVRLTCSGRFEPAVALDTLAKGFKGVVVVGCLLDGFPFEHNHDAVEERRSLFENLSVLLGLDSDKIVYVQSYVSEGGVLECLRKLAQI